VLFMRPNINPASDLVGRTRSHYLPDPAGAGALNFFQISPASGPRKRFLLFLIISLSWPGGALHHDSATSEDNRALFIGGELSPKCRPGMTAHAKGVRSGKPCPECLKHGPLNSHRHRVRIHRQSSINVFR